jgi:hypothetical protein
MNSQKSRLIKANKGKKRNRQTINPFIHQSNRPAPKSAKATAAGKTGRLAQRKSQPIQLASQPTAPAANP